MTDRNFDDLAERFENKLYGHWRGQLRLQLVTKGLLADAECLASGRSLRVLDAGCGLGQISELLAGKGHHVIACDLSSVLIDRARQRIGQSNPEALQRIDFHHGPFQSVALSGTEAFDLVIFHAVLEWVDNPEHALQQLKQLLKPSGELSLLFYNRHAIVFKNLLRGDFRRMQQHDYKGDTGGLTPTNPLLPEDVEQWIQDLSLSIHSRRGIRTFFDYMEQSLDRNKPVRTSLEEILRNELNFSTLDPYRGLARYQLWHCKNHD